MAKMAQKGHEFAEKTVFLNVRKWLSAP